MLFTNSREILPLLLLVATMCVNVFCAATKFDLLLPVIYYNYLHKNIKSSVRLRNLHVECYSNLDIESIAGVLFVTRQKFRQKCLPN